MSERDDNGINLVLLFALVILLYPMAQVHIGRIKSLERRVGQLESERR